MSNVLEFMCPNCGAPLDYKPGGDPVIQCPYCQTKVIVPETLRASGEKSSPPLPDISRNPADFPQIVELLRAGNKIAAIKLFRESTGAGLKEAKLAVEAMQVNIPLDISNLQVPGTLVKTARKIGLSIGCVTLLFVGVLLLLTIIPILFALSSPGGPLFSLRSRLDPTTFANLRLEFGSEGSGPGLFEDPRGISLGPNGDIFVSDYGSGRVQRFTSSGEFLSLWNLGADTYINALAVDRSGTVYVNYKGELWRFQGESGESSGPLQVKEDHYFDDVTFAADGSLVAISNSEDILRINPGGEIELVIPDAVSNVSGDSELDARIATDGLGNFYVMGSFNNAIFKFSADGKFITRFGSAGDEPGQFRAMNAIAVDGQGRVYVSDIRGIQVFDADGRYLNQIKTAGVVFGLVFDDQNRLFCVTNAPKVLSYTIKAP